MTLPGETISDTPVIQAEVTNLISPPPSRLKRNLTRTGWIFFTIFCLTFFTLVKLPQEPLKNSIDSAIATALNPYGMSLAASESKLSFLFGVSYKLSGVTLTLPPPAQPAHFDKLVISPSIFPLLIGRMGGQVHLEDADGILNASLSIRKTNLSVTFNSEKLNLGKLGAFPVLAGIQGTGILEGEGTFSGDTLDATTYQGSTNLRLSKLAIESQTIMGFSIPRLSISEGTVNLAISQGKAKINTFKLGKSGGTDDIQATVTGDVTLAKLFDSSTLNLKTKFSLSEAVMKSFMLLDAIIGIGKQPDGSYAFNITGPIMSPMPMPVTEASGP